MKKFALGIALSACLVPFSSIQAEETGAGCGVGKMIFEGQTGVGPNVVAAVLNDLLSGSSSMTSGTMGCDTTKTVLIDQQKEVFVAANMDNISIDMAQGQGDYLNSLASMMGIDDKDKNSFFSLTQDKYEKLLGENESSPNQLLASLEAVMLEDKTLAKYIQ